MDLKEVTGLKIPIPVVAWLVGVAFTLGGLWIKVQDNDKRIEDEVGGLRADWERDRISQEDRLDRIEERVLFKEGESDE